VQLAGCGNEYELADYSEVEADSSPLTLGLFSYMSLEDVKKTLSLKAGEIVITNKNTSPGREGVPPFDVLTAKIPSAEIGSLNGVVLLTFFNGRLMEVRFFPVDKGGLSQFNSIEIKPFTKVWIGKDYQDRAYVGWLDTRLQKQLNAWIRDYS
jgi:hypothetical protein